MSRATISILGCLALAVVTQALGPGSNKGYTYVISADKQCINLGFPAGACEGDSVIHCAGLVCADENQHAVIMNKPIDGTRCGESQTCSGGHCVQAWEDIAGAQRSPPRPGCISH